MMASYKVSATGGGGHGAGVTARWCEGATTELLGPMETSTLAAANWSERTLESAGGCRPSRSAASGLWCGTGRSADGSVAAFSRRLAAAAAATARR